MSNYYYVAKAIQDSRLEGYERVVRRSQGARARAALARRRDAEEKWR